MVLIFFILIICRTSAGILHALLGRIMELLITGGISITAILFALANSRTGSISLLSTATLLEVVGSR